MRHEVQNPAQSNASENTTQHLSEKPVGGGRAAALTKVENRALPTPFSVKGLQALVKPLERVVS